MSGHSKWSKIKRQKGAADAKRGQLFTKISQQITIAAREGGGDADTNFVLRLAVDKAKQANMPSQNIDRAVKRGTGELKEGSQLETIAYEGYGPGGVAMIVDVVTDNRNRAVTSVRKVLEQYGGHLGEGGSVSWQFEEKGLITIFCEKLEEAEKFGKEARHVTVEPEEVAMAVLDIDGVEDISEIELDDEGGAGKKGQEVYTSKVNLAKVRAEVEKLGFVIDATEVIKVSKNPVELDDDKSAKMQKLIDALEELDEVQGVWSAMEG